MKIHRGALTVALPALNGVVMELDDCAFPLLAGMVKTAEPEEAFGDADVALLVGAMPRKAGMERADLLEPAALAAVTEGRYPDAEAFGREAIAASTSQVLVWRFPSTRISRTTSPNG